MPDEQKMEHVTKAMILNTTAMVTIRLTLADVERALKLDGQADSQNCAGAVCVIKHRDKFDHPVTSLVDWWRDRVYILGKQRSNGQNVCYCYAHHDNVEELFDTDKGLEKLKKKLEKTGFIDITLHPVKRGVSPKTGKPVHKRGPGPKRGGERRGAKIGGDLRYFNYITARKAA